MTGRSEIDELQALAESISEEAHGFRANRRRRILEHRDRRFVAEGQAPRKRRWRHRLAAIGALLMIGLAFGTWGVISHAENKVPHSAPPKPVTSVPGYSLPWVKAGRIAASAITSQGRATNPATCQAWYDENDLGSVNGQAGQVWHDGFIRSCVTTQNNIGGTG